jgi:hypothetical protein
MLDTAGPSAMLAGLFLTPAIMMINKVPIIVRLRPIPNLQLRSAPRVTFSMNIPMQADNRELFSRVFVVKAKARIR